MTRMLGSQLETLSSFVHTTTTHEMASMWRPVQDVLAVNGLSRYGCGEPPIEDAMIDDFKQSVLDALRPPLSKSLHALFSEPTPDLIPQLQQMTKLGIADLEHQGILEPDAAHLLISSVKLYLNLSTQMERLYEFLTTKGEVPGELMRDIRLLFAIHKLPTRMLTLMETITPSGDFVYRSSLQELLKQATEKRLLQAVSNAATWKELTHHHGVTLRILDDALSVGIVSSSFIAHMHQVLGTPPMYQLAMNMMRKHPRSSICLGSAAASSSIAAAVNYLLGGSASLSLGLLTFSLALVIVFAAYARATVNR